MRREEIKQLKEQLSVLSKKVKNIVSEDLMIKSVKPGEIVLTDPSNDEVGILQKADQTKRDKILIKIADDIKEDGDLQEKRGYSAKAAHAGHDIGKKGKNFKKIATSAGKKYGSKAAGERVAGAILSKLRNESAETDKSLMMEGMSMFINGEIDEKLKPSMGVGAYIDDFVHSKNKRFAGKSKEQRIKMAKGAYYGATKESVNEEAMDVEHFTMTPELLLRSMEWAKENAGEDIQLHKYIEAMSDLMTAKDVLDSDDYENIVSKVTPNDPEINDDGPGSSEEHGQ